MIDTFAQLENALKDAVLNGILPNTEFALTYDGDDDSDGWTAIAGNPSPKDGPIPHVEPILMTGPHLRADQAVDALLILLSV